MAEIWGRVDLNPTSGSMMDVIGMESVCYRSSGSGTFPCSGCGNIYRHKRSLQKHIRLECGKEPQFHCPYCPIKMKQKGNLQKHIKKLHGLE